LSTIAGTIKTMETATEMLTTDELAAWRAFLRAHSTMLRRIAADLEEADLPPLTWYDVLAALSDSDGALRQVELAERVLLSNSGLSRLIDRIEKADLVRRTACDTDRRSFYIELTGQGREMLERMWPVYARGVAEDFLPAIGSKSCELRQMLETIGTACDRVNAAEAATAES
jgi:DNA-binding MarR family transcriptional regulator